MRVKADGTIHQESARKTDYWIVIRLLLIVFSAVFGVSLMNLFIAVLTVSYSKAKEKDLIFFSRLQAHKVIETQAIRIGGRLISKWLCLDRIEREAHTGAS